MDDEEYYSKMRNQYEHHIKSSGKKKIQNFTQTCAFHGSEDAFMLDEHEKDMLSECMESEND